MIDEKKLIENRPEYLNPNMDDEIKSAHNKGWNDCNKYWFSIIEEQSKINEWIPVSERLPDDFPEDECKHKIILTIDHGYKFSRVIFPQKNRYGYDSLFSDMELLYNKTM